MEIAPPPLAAKPQQSPLLSTDPVPSNVPVVIQIDPPAELRLLVLMPLVRIAPLSISVAALMRMIPEPLALFPAPAPASCGCSTLPYDAPATPLSPIPRPMWLPPLWAVDALTPG